MKTEYDPEADALYVRLMPDEAVIVETREVAPGVMLDLDAEGNLVGLEVISLRSRAAGQYAKAAQKAAAE